MFHTGLVSVTFRKLSTDHVVRLVKQAQLTGIEWGGDVHVPHGDVDRAREVGEQTRGEGLKVAAYGSYYRLANPDPQQASFERVLETAVALGAPLIRVWAGTKGSMKMTEADREAVVADARRVAEMARGADVEVSCEYHGGTLTDNHDSAERFYKAVKKSNFGSYWQPLGNETVQLKRSLEVVLPWLTNLHVYYWISGQRKSLADGYDLWKSFFSIARNSQRDHYAMLEFVKDDAPENFMKDARTLRELAGEANT
jgi:sugar phosphate isomerase/epimerase